MEYTIDAKGQILGRLASEIAQILQGKKHANYAPHVPGNDRVIVKNASKLLVSGRKAEQKIYYHHTGYMGHLREKIYKEAFAKSPEKVLLLAVKRMLPQNFILQNRLNRLVIEK